MISSWPHCGHTPCLMSALSCMRLTRVESVILGLAAPETVAGVGARLVTVPACDLWGSWRRSFLSATRTALAAQAPHRPERPPAPGHRQRLEAACAGRGG